MYLSETMCSRCPVCACDYAKVIKIDPFIKGDIPLMNTKNTENDIQLYLATILMRAEIL